MTSAKKALANVLAAKKSLTQTKSSASTVLKQVDELRKTVRAAKDNGSSKGDKDRQSSLQALVDKAAELREVCDLASFPEVETACKQVDKLAELVTKMAEAQIKLKAAPANSEEAAQHQINLDKIRDGVDTMLKPLQATMETMETLVIAAATLEQQFEEMSEQVKLLEEKLKSDKERLAAIAKAVESTATVSASKKRS